METYTETYKQEKQRENKKAILIRLEADEEFLIDDLAEILQDIQEEEKLDRQKRIDAGEEVVEDNSSTIKSLNDLYRHMVKQFVIDKTKAIAQRNIQREEARKSELKEHFNFD